jgi:hypothetical protein
MPALLMNFSNRNNIMIIAIPTYMREDNQKCYNSLPEDIQKNVILFTHSGRSEILSNAIPNANVIDLGVTDGIADVRQKLIDYVFDVMGESKVFIMDDGCRFSKRLDMKLKPMESDDFVTMFKQVSENLEGFPMVGISDQGGNNRVEEDFKIAQRSYSCYGINIPTLRKNDIRFDAMYQKDNDIKLYEDFHLILDILTKGLENLVCYNYAFSHPHGKKGGNSTIRTNELQKQCIMALIRQHPGLAKIVKKPNPSWKAGLDDQEDFRWEVQISWKKAWEQGRNGIGNDLGEFF